MEEGANAQNQEPGGLTPTPLGESLKKSLNRQLGPSPEGADMQVSVVIQKLNGTGFRAKTLLPPLLSSEGPT